MSSSAVPGILMSRRKPLAACVAAIFALSASSAVYATTYSVTNCLDDTNPGSLRWAAGQAANSGDIIDMTNITDTSACFTDEDGFANTIVIASEVTIANGATISGPAVPALAVTSKYTGLVFSSPGSMTINDLGINYGRNSTPGSFGNVYGGCVYAHTRVTMSGVKIDHCTAYTNAAGHSAKGGAIGVFQAGVTLTNSTITNSQATSHNSGDAAGGAVYAYLNVTLIGSSVDYATATANSGNVAGGGIALHRGSLVLTDSSIRHAHATATGTGHAYGGGIYAGNTGTAALNSASIEYTYASVQGANGGTAKGGGIFANGAVTMAGGSVVGVNSATTYSTITTANALGGGIYGGSSVALSNGCVVLYGSAQAAGGIASGGGIYSRGLATVNYAAVFYNEASSPFISEGGAIYSNGGLVATYSNVYGNKAMSATGDGVGGAIAIRNGNASVRGTTISGNYAHSEASALNFSSGLTTTFTAVNSTISGNSTGSVGGQAVAIRAYRTTFFNSTIAYNTGGTSPGVEIDGANAGSTVGLYSTLISSNSFTSGAQSDFYAAPGVAFTVSSSNNLIRNPNGSVPAGTLTGKCPFLHALANNGGPTKTHRLGGGSSAKNPAIDAGSNPLSLGSDQRGGSLTATSPLRVSGIAADIGAYEVQQADIIFDSEFDTCPN